MENLNILEKKSRELDPGAAGRELLLKNLWTYIQSFINDLPDEKAYRGTERKLNRQTMNQFDEQPSKITKVLIEFDEKVMKSGINGAHGGHLGYVPGGGIFPSALGDFLAAVTNKYAGVYFAAPGAAAMENSLVDWMGSIFGLPENTRGGTLTSGGSIANLLAVTTARDRLRLTSDEFSNLVVYSTLQTHHCIDKALKIAGLSDAKMHRVPMNEDFKMDPLALREALDQDIKEGLKPFMLVATAGTTDMGIMDDLKSLAEIAAEHNDLWYHVDAAYGGFFNLVEDLKPKFTGIEKADSIVVDPHKSLFLPFGTGAFLIRDKQLLFDSQHIVADYMQDTQDKRFEESPADLSPELTRHYRGLRIWLPLKLFGMTPFRAALAEKYKLCQYAWEELQNIRGVETGPEPDLSITYFRYIPKRGDAERFNKKLLDRIQEDGRIFLSSTRIDGVFHIRIAILHFRTHLEQVKLCLKIIKKYITDLDKL